MNDPGRVKPADQGKQTAEHVAPADVSLLELVTIFLRYRWYLLGMSGLGFVLAVALVALGPRTWTATTSFSPQVGSGRTPTSLSNLAGQFGFDLTGGEFGQTPQFYAHLVRSREILGAIATDTFVVVDTTGFMPRGILQGTLVELLEFDMDESPPDVRRHVSVSWLRDQAVSANTDPETGLVQVAVTTPWASLSKDVTERVLQLVNEFNLETRQSQAAAERRFIEGRLEQAKQDLWDAEDALQRFLQNNRDFRNSPELQFQHDRLVRAVGMRQQVYTSLVQAYEQARINEVRNTPVVTVVESPERPTTPDSRNLLIKAVLGLILGGGLAGTLIVGSEFIQRQKMQEPEKFAELTSLWNEIKKALLKPLGHS